MLKNKSFKEKPNKKKTKMPKFKNGILILKRIFKLLRLSLMKKDYKTLKNKIGEKIINNKMLDLNLYNFQQLSNS
jgi:hypothetical protein